MVDYSVYPELQPDEFPKLETDYEKADYLARICAAWDFGIAPTRETFALFRSWRNVFDCFPRAASPAYHALRMIFGWPKGPGRAIARPRYELLDAQDGREPDEFAEVL